MKKRFGVSLPEELFRKLERASVGSGVDRSRIISAALACYLSRMEHEASEHSCCGILIVVSGKAQSHDLEEIFDHSLITSHFHLHEGDECIRLVYVRGSSDRIKSMILRLTLLAKRVEFVPLH